MALSWTNCLVMSAPKRYPAPLGDTPHPLMSGIDQMDREGMVILVLVFDLARRGMEREGSHHLDRTKEGRTWGHHVELPASCRLHGSAKRMVSVRLSGKMQGVPDQLLGGSGSTHHEHRTLDRLRSLPTRDNQRPHSTISRRLNSSTFFDTRRKSHRPG